jgi:hypothetical protein
MSAPSKCAHSLCSCTVPEGKKFCSEICEDSASVTAIKCDCKHPGCSSAAL